jgi:hypothetical protein
VKAQKSSEMLFEMLDPEVESRCSRLGGTDKLLPGSHTTSRPGSGSTSSPARSNSASRSPTPRPRSRPKYKSADIGMGGWRDGDEKCGKTGKGMEPDSHKHNGSWTVLYLPAKGRRRVFYQHDFFTIASEHRVGRCRGTGGSSLVLAESRGG